MGFADLLWDSGKDNMGGIVGEIYFCPVEHIESLPALSAVGSLQTAVDDIVCKAGKKFHRIYHTAETGKVESTTVGDFDGKSKLNLLTFFYPGDDETLAEQVRLLQNTPGVYICRDSKGNLRLLGVTNFDEDSTELTLESPAYIQITNGTLGAAGADRRGTTFEVVHKAPHRPVFYMGEVPLEEMGLALVFDSEIVSFTPDESGAMAGTSLLISPRVVYENGRTHFVFQETTLGRLCIITYDENYGVGRRIGFRGRTGNYDVHHIPCVFEENGVLYVVVEKDHNTQPMSILKIRESGDYNVFELSTSTIGGAPTYPKYAKRNGVYMFINQMNDTLAGVIKNNTGDIEGTWGTNTQISQKAADEDEQYNACPLNADAMTDKVPVVILARNDDSVPATWFRRYLVKVESTADDTYRFYNWDESFSKTSTITSGELATYCKYYDTGSDVTQGYGTPCCLDNDGNFYDIAGDGSGGYDFIYQLVGEAAATIKAITLPGSPVLYDTSDIGGDGQGGAQMLILAISPTEIYAIFRVEVGALGKPYLYKTTDLGDTWTEVVADMVPDFDQHVLSVALPFNYGAIENNNNFCLVFNGIADATYASVLFKRAAFGAIQEETGDIFNVPPFTETEYNALCLRSYYVEAGKITNTGTTCNSLIDQSPSGQNAASTGSPVLDSSTEPTFVAHDGVNDAFTIPTTGLTALTEGTVIIVAKGTPGAGGSFLTVSNAANAFMSWGKGPGDTTRHNNNNEVLVDGKTPITDAYHIFAFIHQNGANSDVLHYLDGELQLRNPTTRDTDEGEFFSGVSSINNIQIGRLIRSTTTWVDFDLKHLAIMDTPLNQAELAKAMKYLSNKYSISLNSHFQ